MNNKDFVRTLRKVVRSEVRKVIKEELTEILVEGLKPTLKDVTSYDHVAKQRDMQTEEINESKPKQIFKNNEFADILNETKIKPESNTGISEYAAIMESDMPEMKYTSADAQGFGTQQTLTPPKQVVDPETNKSHNVPGYLQNVLSKDYSALMGAIDKKKKQKQGMNAV